MTIQNGRAFSDWLRAQLKARKMSQRHLALRSGVDHSTISRLIQGDRIPSLGTATKLARGLRELSDDADTLEYLGLMSSRESDPSARVESALRSDHVLSEMQVRQIREYYVAVRQRYRGSSAQAGEAVRLVQPPDLRGTPSAGRLIGAGVGLVTATRVGQARPTLRPPSHRDDRRLIRAPDSR